MGITGINSISEASKTNTTQDTCDNKYDWLKDTGSIGLALGGGLTINQFYKKVHAKASTAIKKEQMFSSYILNGKEARMMFKDSGLADKGVKLKDLSGKPIDTSKLEKPCKTYADMVKRVHEESKISVKRGDNSSYYSPSKEIFCNLKSSPMSVPHEMGHAMNCTSKNPFLKILTKGKYLQLLTPFLMTAALVKKPNEKRNESDSLIGKSFDFVKDNCVGLSAVAAAPVVIEEGLASFRGAKLAKKYLTPEKLKAINVLNYKAWLTYAISGASTIAATYVIDKIRNATAVNDKTSE